MPPSKSQVWVVLRAADDTRRLVYSLAAGFLGRMCLSGEMHDLREDQWTLTQNALVLYRKLSRLIAHADGQRLGQWGQSYLHPTGWQAVVWSAADQNQCVVVIHTFGKAPAAIEAVPLPPGHWHLRKTFAETG
ncbi:hypothetical protein QQ054_08600 [Oscillatoria amoena NRMC-F 0135]|nr:hypothetical protein [Oscillatoria amoena NRMC-F 0135]